MPRSFSYPSILRRIVLGVTGLYGVGVHTRDISVNHVILEFTTDELYQLLFTLTFIFSFLFLF